MVIPKTPAANKKSSVCVEPTQKKSKWNGRSTSSRREPPNKTGGDPIGKDAHAPSMSAAVGRPPVGLRKSAGLPPVRRERNSRDSHVSIGASEEEVRSTLGVGVRATVFWSYYRQWYAGVLVTHFGGRVYEIRDDD